jgi:hypothetical protein
MCKVGHRFNQEGKRCQSGCCKEARFEGPCNSRNEGGKRVDSRKGGGADFSLYAVERDRREGQAVSFHGTRHEENERHSAGHYAGDLNHDVHGPVRHASLRGDLSTNANSHNGAEDALALSGTVTIFGTEVNDGQCYCKKGFVVG